MSTANIYSYDGQTLLGTVDTSNVNNTLWELRIDGLYTTEYDIGNFTKVINIPNCSTLYASSADGTLSHLSNMTSHIGDEANYYVYAFSTLSDLTNTAWKFVDEVNVLDPTGEFNIDFSALNNSTFFKIEIGMSWNYYRFINYYRQSGSYTYTDEAYYGSAWTNTSYQTIAITGGTDSTNTTLIEWFQTNAVQLPVGNLTNTKWVLNNNITITGVSEYYIDFTSNDTSYNMFYPYQTFGTLSYYKTGYTEGLTVYTSNAWVDPAYQTIVITGGNDAGKIVLISWLLNNATQILPTMYAVEYETLHCLGNKDEIGDLFPETITLTPKFGFTLPDTVVVTNATLDSYDSTTGEIVVSDPTTDVIISGDGTVIPGTYCLISLQTLVDIADSVRYKLSENKDIPVDELATEIGNIQTT